MVSESDFDDGVGLLFSVVKLSLPDVDLLCTRDRFGQGRKRDLLKTKPQPVEFKFISVVP